MEKGRYIIKFMLEHFFVIPHKFLKNIELCSENEQEEVFFSCDFFASAGIIHGDFYEKK